MWLAGLPQGTQQDQSPRSQAEREGTHDEDRGLRTAPLLQLLCYARRDRAEGGVTEALAGVVDPDHLQLPLGCVRVHLRQC